MMSVSMMEAGMVIPETVKHVTQEEVNLYAEASRDFNPIHIDEEFAKKTPLGGTIAHGMLVLAYISEAMTEIFGSAWLSRGGLKVRFKTPARPEDTLTISSNVRQVIRDGDKPLVTCDVLCRNQCGETVIIGEATLRAERDDISY